jgi:hypothetical protein
MTMPEAQIKLARFALCVNKTFPLFFVNPSPMRQTDENTRCLPTSVKNKWGILIPIPSPLPLHKRRCTKEHWLRTPVRWQLQSKSLLLFSLEAVSPERGVVITELQSSIWLSINFSLSLFLSLSLPLSSSLSMKRPVLNHSRDQEARVRWINRNQSYTPPPTHQIPMQNARQWLNKPFFLIGTDPQFFYKNVCFPV